MNKAVLKAKMAEQSVTQTTIAKALGCTQAAVSQKLNGDRRISIEEAAAIAKLLGLTDNEVIRIFFNT